MTDFALGLVWGAFAMFAAMQEAMRRLRQENTNLRMLLATSSREVEKL